MERITKALLGKERMCLCKCPLCEKEYTKWGEPDDRPGASIKICNQCAPKSVAGTCPGCGQELLVKVKSLLIKEVRNEIISSLFCPGCGIVSLAVESLELTE